MFSTSERIRTEFNFLLERGYSLAADSDAGMAGTVAYRSPLLWISLEWDRGDPWLSFTVTNTTPNSFFWPLVDRVLNAKGHPEYGPNRLPEAPISQLATFVRDNLGKLEIQLSPPHRIEFEARLRAEQGNARRELAEFQHTRRFR